MSAPVGAASSSAAGSRKRSQRTPAAKAAARPNTGRFVRTASATPSAGNAVATTRARSARDCERTSATPNASAGTTASTPKWRKASPAVVASFQNVRPCRAGRGARRKGIRNGTERRTEKTLLTAAERNGRCGEVAGGEDEEARGQVPRVRREDGREKDAVEERSPHRPDPAREAGEREEERERDGVRVEVTEPEREERPLRDRVRDAPRGDPPVEVGEGPLAERLPRAVERSPEYEDGAREEREPPPAAARADGSVGGERRERGQEGRDEVVRVLGGDARGARREREEVRPEVVVREAGAGEPRVHERESRRRHEPREDGEVHRLLRLADLAERRADPEEEAEDREEEDERRGEGASAREHVEEVPPAPEEQGDEGEPRERQREDADRRLAEEPRDEPAGQRRRDEADGQGEREDGLGGRVVRSVAAEQARERGHPRRARQEKDRGEENNGQGRHGSIQGNTKARPRPG